MRQWAREAGMEDNGQWPQSWRDLIEDAVERGAVDGPWLHMAGLWLAHVDDGWKPIETAPKDGTRILVCRNELVEPVTVGYWSMVECRFVTPLTLDQHPATHWMPLPARPSEALR